MWWCVWGGGGALPPLSHASARSPTQTRFPYAFAVAAETPFAPVRRFCPAAIAQAPPPVAAATTAVPPGPRGPPTAALAAALDVPEAPEGARTVTPPLAAAVALRGPQPVEFELEMLPIMDEPAAAAVFVCASPPDSPHARDAGELEFVREPADCTALGLTEPFGTGPERDDAASDRTKRQSPAPEGPQAGGSDPRPPVAGPAELGHCETRATARADCPESSAEGAEAGAGVGAGVNSCGPVAPASPERRAAVPRAGKLRNSGNELNPWGFTENESDGSDDEGPRRSPAKAASGRPALPELQPGAGVTGAGASSASAAPRKSRVRRSWSLMGASDSDGEGSDGPGPDVAVLPGKAKAEPFRARAAVAQPKLRLGGEGMQGLDVYDLSLDPP